MFKLTKKGKMYFGEVDQGIENEILVFIILKSKK